MVSLRKRARACGTKMIVLYFNGSSFLGSREHLPCTPAGPVRELTPEPTLRIVAVDPMGASPPCQPARPGRKSEGAKAGGRKASASDRCGARDAFALFEIGDRARDAQGPVDRPRRELQAPHAGLQDAPAGGIERGALHKFLCSEVGVAGARPSGAARGACPRPLDARPDPFGRFRRPRGLEVGPRERAHRDVQVDPIEQGAGDPAGVARALPRVAGAGPPRVARETAGAGIARRDEQHVAGKDAGAADANDRDRSFLERLADRLERVAPELRKLVEEEDAAVSERDLAGDRASAPADEPGRRNPVMGGAKRRRPDEARAGGKNPGDGVDARDLDRLGARKWREDPGQPPGEHRLAGAGRPRQEQMVASGRGDLGRAAGDELPAEVAEIGGGIVAAHALAEGEGRDRPGPEDVLDGGGQVGDGNDLDALDGRGLERARGGQHDLLEAGVAGRERQTQRAPHGANLSTQAELADEDAAGRARRARPAEPQQAEGHRKVERRAAFPEVGRGEVDGDGPRRDREARVAQGGPDAIARLAHSGVGEADDGESRQAVGRVDLDVEHARLDAERGGGMNPGEHETSSGPRRPDRG